MLNALWALAAAVAVLWPAALSGPLDGAPLDTPAEVIVIGVLLPLIVLSSRQALASRAVRALIVALLVWKAVTATALTPDGWCVRFTSRAPIYLDGLTVPHSWDVRADWRSSVPECSAVMTRPYGVLEAFPAWFFNLPPAEPGHAATRDDRPPNLTTRLDVDGYLLAGAPGVLRVALGEDVRARVSLDDRDVTGQATADGVTVPAGSHRVSVAGDLVRSHWSLVPTWNGTDVWSAAIATRAPAGRLDRWLRPWGRWVAPLLVAAIALVAGWGALAPLGSAWPLGLAAAVAAAMAAAAASGRESVARASVAVLLVAAVPALPRRWRTGVGAWWLLAAPVMALFATIAAGQAGIFTWYSSGDDWWMFQRFAYRIYLQGHWIEAGEPTFWFQPLYRYVAGALHVIFGDSSAGELIWDGLCAGVGAVFAFHVTKAMAGARAAMAAAALTLAMLLLGPAWYLFGRGLSELTSMGFLYAAAICALRARRGGGPAALAAGVLAALAFLTRLNNLPAALGVALFALPMRVRAASALRPRDWLHRASLPVVAAVFGAVALTMWLLTARTYHFTRVPSLLYGTQAGLLSNWQPGMSLVGNARNIAASLLMVLTMSDPPAFDLRALPVLMGAVAAVAAVAGLPVARRLPLSVAGFLLAALSSAVVARGSAYSGRFSVHLVPAASALAVGAACLVWQAVRPAGLRKADGP